MLHNRCDKENKPRHNMIGAWVVWALGCGLLGVTGSAVALELGDFDLQSHLNEPLEARIPLSAVTADQWQGLQAGVAPPADFRQAGLAMSPDLSRLRFEPVRRAAGESYIRVLSTEAINAPYLEVVVEARAGSDRALKAYTVLFDPPPQPVIRRHGPVKSGETLWSIASRLKPSDTVTVQQVVIALFNANPGAFKNRHIKQLKTGVSLRIPSLEAVKAISPERAKAEVRAQEARQRNQPGTERSAAPPPMPVAKAVNDTAEPSVQRDGVQQTQSVAEEIEAPAGAEMGADTVDATAIASLPLPVTASVMPVTQSFAAHRGDAPPAVATTLPKGFFDDVVADVRADPVQMGLLGGGLVGLLGFLGLSKCRRRYADEAAEAPPLIVEPPDWPAAAVITTAADGGVAWSAHQQARDASGKRVEAAADLAWPAADTAPVGAAARPDAAADAAVDFSFEVDDARTVVAASDDARTMALDFGHLDFNAVDTGPDRNEPAVGDLDALEAQLASDTPLGTPGAAARDRQPVLPTAMAATAGAVSAVIGDAGRDSETKLDLAKAYKDMGDLEGARMMLAEVLAEGSEDQCAAARALLAQLAP